MWCRLFGVGTINFDKTKIILLNQFVLLNFQIFKKISVKLLPKEALTLLFTIKVDYYPIKVNQSNSTSHSIAILTL